MAKLQARSGRFGSVCCGDVYGSALDSAPDSDMTAAASAALSGGGSGTDFGVAPGPGGHGLKRSGFGSSRGAMIATTPGRVARRKSFESLVAVQEGDAEDEDGGEAPRNSSSEESKAAGYDREGPGRQREKTGGNQERVRGLFKGSEKGSDRLTKSAGPSGSGRLSKGTGLGGSGRLSKGTGLSGSGRLSRMASASRLSSTSKLRQPDAKLEA